MIAPMGVKIYSPGARERISSNGRDRAAVSGSFGLGDAVAVVAKPMAKALGVDPDCAPCARRKARLNAMSERAGARIRKLFKKD